MDVGFNRGVVDLGRGGWSTIEQAGCQQLARALPYCAKVLRGLDEGYRALAESIREDPMEALRSLVGVDVMREEGVAGWLGFAAPAAVAAFLTRGASTRIRLLSRPPRVAGQRDGVGGLVRGTCSFAATTAVLMADATSRAISEIEIGDAVLAEDPETGERGARQVTYVWAHSDTVIDLEIDGEALTTTEGHPFWNATDGQWQRADALDRGDHLATADGKQVGVAGLDTRSARTTTAYNLTVDDIHTFFVVVGDHEVLVHDECPLILRVEPLTGNSRSSGRLPTRRVAIPLASR